MSASLLQSEERVLPTLEADGSRRWLYPRLAKGKLLAWRMVVGWVLIAVFNVLPFISFRGKPIVLLDIASRHFTLMGYTFLPRDTFLLALVLLSWILGVFFFTAVFGRVWCGWGCPQTVYLELVYRPIERFFLGRSGVGGKPKAGLGFWRYGLMYVAFFLVSMHLANIFLSYFVGAEQVKVWVTRSPLEHPTGFLIVLSVTLGMLLDFTLLREQVCGVMCPYARLQSVLLDRHSLVVRYDERRGEPSRGRKEGKGERGKGKVERPGDRDGMARSSGSSLTPYPLPLAPSSGDCVDCTLCVQVCPAGIDIRHGVQLECINCAQCVDACNAVMRKVGKAQGLIRYASQAGLEKGGEVGAGGWRQVVRARTVVYACIIAGVLSLLVYLLATKSPVDVLLVRSPGMPFVRAVDGRVENTVRVQLTNRTDSRQVLGVSLVGADGKRVEILKADRGEVVLESGETATKPVHILAEEAVFEMGKRIVTVRVQTGDGAVVDRAFQLFGPG